METLLSELELDLREINFLAKSLPDEPVLNRIVVRRIKQMQAHLNELLTKVENTSVEKPEPVIDIPVPVESQPDNESTHVPLIVKNESTIILADSLKSATDIKSLFTLNDKFLFSRELFGGDMERMNSMLQQISEMESYNNVISLLSSVLEVEDDNETFNDFLELIRKHFA